MKKLLKYLILCSFLLTFVPFKDAYARSKYYGTKYCDQYNFKCIKIKRGESWEKLFPNKRHEMLVRRLNRMNTPLYPGMVIAIPKNLHYIDLNDLSPLPKYNAVAKKYNSSIVVDQSDLAWGAYNSNGRLIKWGPISGGKNYCPDVGSKCKTIQGVYTIKSKRGKNCISNKFPIGKGGAKMPYCMFFHGGYALHGSYKVPGYNDSHGCVRLFIEDAEWLSEEFTKIGDTVVIIQH